MPLLGCVPRLDDRYRQGCSDDKAVGDFDDWLSTVTMMACGAGGVVRRLNHPNKKGHTYRPQQYRDGMEK